MATKRMSVDEFKTVRASTLEDILATELTRIGLVGFVREYQFAKCLNRKWRVDFAFIDRAILIEVEGGSYVRGRHVRPTGFQNDCEKYNAATLLGWRLLRYTGQDISKRLDSVIADIEAILK